MNENKQLKTMIDKFLAEEEYQIVSELSEVASKIKNWQEMKDWEARQEKVEAAVKGI